MLQNISLRCHGELLAVAIARNFFINRQSNRKARAEAAEMSFIDRDKLRRYLRQATGVQAYGAEGEQAAIGRQSLQQEHKLKRRKMEGVGPPMRTKI